MKNLFYLVLVALFVSCGSKPLDLNVMTFNVRYDNPEDSLNNWQYRKDVAAGVVKSHNIDVMGGQEVLANQLNDLKQRLPEYASIGVGREDGEEKGEYSPILYRKDRFAEVKSGYFWLSETPEVAGSKGWDGACERIATWAILQDMQTKGKFFFINTHLDHVGKVARQEGVTLLLNKANELSEGLPIVITGDFNSRPNSDVVKHVLESGKMKDSRLIAGQTAGGKATFHGFGRVPEDRQDVIDYIFVSDGIEVPAYEILPQKLDDIYVSDHTPVVAHIIIK